MSPAADHYFSADPASASREDEVTVALRGREFRFLTDAGTFSPRFLDRGTRLLLSTLPLPMSGEVLDWGAGWGPIGIVVAAFSGEAHVVMAEVNERAADLARRNADRNRVTNIEILPGDAFATLGARRFDAILTNPPIHAGKATVLRLIEDAHQRLTAGGALWMVIRTHAGAKSYFTALQARFGDARHLDTRGGYRVFRAGLTKGPGRL